jgi:hypothetical protein
MKMKTIKKAFALIVGAMLFITSCQQSVSELSAPLTKSQIQYSVVQDLNDAPGGNTVILTNSTAGTISLWDYGTGRSTRAADTIHFAFPGDYIIKFSAVSGGGVVVCDPVTVHVTANDLRWVNDPLWTAISGGVNNEKVWLLDIDAKGVSKYFTSPVYFAGDEMIWDHACSKDGGNCWEWDPDWKGNQWITSAADYGTMKFNLKGGPFVIVDQKATATPGSYNGTYFLDKDAKTLNFTFSDASGKPLNPSLDQIYSKATIISLTENTMQLAFHNPTKAEYEIFNYITKSYSDSWVAPVLTDPNFNFGNQGQLLATSNTKSWKLDTQVPFNWTDLSGSFLNAWNSRADIIAAGWPAYGDADVAGIDGVSLTFVAGGGVTLVADNGATTSGTYTVDETTNMITFSSTFVPSIPIGGWAVATTTSKNKWKIVIVEKDTLTGEAKGIWFGKRDETGKSEYMVFHFVLK